MFTGIVDRQGAVLRPGRRLEVETGYADLKPGESVAVAGVCLTVARLRGTRAGFDLVPETLKRTTLGSLRKGYAVNLERALRASDRLSGHVVQGHVDGTGVVARAGSVLRIETPLAAALVPKGSVAVDGVSLTVVDVETGAFTVALIPTTRRITTLGRVRKSDRVNVELDVLTKRKPSRVTKELLARAGFL
jgi:riboflavin synthase alpha subunit